MRLEGREARIKLDKTVEGDEGRRELECVFDRRVA
jgi:hypothetical protein